MVAFIILAVLLALLATPVYAQGIPALPHAFYGAVDVNGSPAPAGTEVEVRGEGVQTDVGNNPMVTTVEGEYGSSDPLEPKLIVQGEIAEGVTLTFYVNGVSTGQTAEWHSGGVTELNLTATISGPPPETTEPPPGTTPEPTPEPAPEPTPEPAPEPAPEAPPEPLLPPPPPGEPAPGEPAPGEPAPGEPAPGEPGNWPVLWILIGGLVVVVVARRRAY